MNTLLSREKVDSGSNYNFPDKMEIPRVPSSVFNLSHLVSGTLSNAGIIFPITWFEYMPTDRFKISIRHLIRVMPQVVPLMSRQRIFIHAFAIDYTDLQSDFNVLMSKGYSGNVVKKVAPLTADNIDPDVYNDGSGVVEPGSLADFLGLPQGVSYSDLIARGVSCLPFLAYEQIYKHYYMNKNYYIENRNWLPDDEETFRVNEDGVLASNTDDEHDKVYFGKLHYRDYPDDYFTSGLPFAQRGDRPLLSMSVASDEFFNFYDNYHSTANPLTVGFFNSTQNADDTYNVINNPAKLNLEAGQYFTDVVANNATGDSQNYSYGFVLPKTLLPSQPVNVGNSFGDSEAHDFALRQQDAYFNGAISKGKVNINIGADELRTLLSQQVELEKMARTDGSFNSFIKTFFGTNSSEKDPRPLYLGGTYSQISFTEVLQTSQSSTSSALGQIAGHGISIDNNGYLGDFTARNFGLIMIVATIMPDVYYSQGLEKKWTRSKQAEFFLPERAKLGLQPIKNEEIDFTGDTSQDNGLFAWQNPFDEFRYMQNRICGKLAQTTSKSFYPYTQARKFENPPTLSQSFAIADDVRKDYLFAYEEDAYLYQFSLDIRAVRPLPYKAIPNNFGF